MPKSGRDAEVESAIPRQEGILGSEVAAHLALTIGAIRFRRRWVGTEVP